MMPGKYDGIGWWLSESWNGPRQCEATGLDYGRTMTSTSSSVEGILKDTGFFVLENQFVQTGDAFRGELYHCSSPPLHKTSASSYGIVINV